MTILVDVLCGAYSTLHVYTYTYMGSVSKCHTEISSFFFASYIYQNKYNNIVKMAHKKYIKCIKYDWKVIGKCWVLFFFCLFVWTENQIYRFVTAQCTFVWVRNGCMWKLNFSIFVLLSVLNWIFVIEMLHQMCFVPIQYNV